MRIQVGICSIALVLGFSVASADAAGTARIQQPDGSVKVYNDVRIRVADQRMTLSSADGKGTLIINKASCTAVANLLRCLPYSAELDQNGRSVAIALRSGTVWLNASGEAHQLPYSSTQLPARGVLMSFETTRGTVVALTGKIDEVTK